VKEREDKWNVTLQLINVGAQKVSCVLMIKNIIIAKYDMNNL
jgi:hypothetical protein